MLLAIIFHFCATKMAMLIDKLNIIIIILKEIIIMILKEIIIMIFKENN